MAWILHIESSSTVCSVAVSNNSNLIALKEINNGYTHAENIHVFINELLKESNINPKNLNAISVSSGPGSYTGLRIGFSAAKGLAYALQIPLITINTLQALSYQAIQTTNKDALYCAMTDARRMEVYCAVYDQAFNTIIAPQALVLNEQSISVFNKQKSIYFFGDGMPKAKALLQSIPNSFFIEDINASAKAMVAIAYEKYLVKDFSDTAYSEPDYLKEFFFTSSKK